VSGKKAKCGAVAGYLYSVEWSEDDTIYIGRVAEFPSLAAHGDTPQSALDEIMSVVRAVLTDLRDSNEPILEEMTICFQQTAH
jgi:predicted RNase H-like HicB family nuclease